MNPLGVGIVGCGEVAQVMHLPALFRLPERFRIVALCDVSRTVRDGVGNRWGVAARVAEYGELVARAEVDVVLVAGPHASHAPVTVAAIAAGKHVLVEKPAAVNLSELDLMLAAEARGHVVVQVGYMRRYAPAFLAAVRHVAELRAAHDIRHARVHDFIGDNALIAPAVARVIRGDDVPPAQQADAQAREAAALHEALGDAPPDLLGAYRLMLGLNSHDLSAMRELLGLPQRVLAATQRGGLTLTATFDYGDFVCLFESGYDGLARFDASIDVYGSRRHIHLQYDTPYVPNLPVRLTVTEATPGGGVSARVEHPAWGDPFVDEWVALHDAIMGGQRPKTSLADARHDLELFQAMLALMRADGSAGGLAPP